MALSAIGEGCHQQMEAILHDIVKFVLQYCKDLVRRLRQHSLHVALSLTAHLTLDTVRAVGGHFEMKPLLFCLFIKGYA